MKKMSSMVLFIITISFGCCKQESYSPNKITEISLNVPGIASRIPNSFTHDDDISIVTLQTLKDNIIYIYKFDSTGIISQNKINPKITNYSYFYNLFINGVDSIFVFYPDLSNLQVIDSSGQEILTLNLSEGLPTLAPENLMTYFNKQIYLYNTSSLYNVGKKVERSQYYETIKPIYQIDLSSDQKFSVYFWASFPIAYSQKNLDFSDYFPDICPYNSSQVIISYTSDDSVYLYENLMKKESYLCKSKYIDKFIPYPEEKLFDMAYSKNYHTIEPKYLNIIYDKYKNQFYRVVKHRFPKKSKVKSKRSKWTWSIIILSDELEVLNEVVFNYQYYNPTYIIPSIYGLWVGNTPKSRDDTQHIQLSLFEL